MNLKSFEDMQKTTVFFILKPANAIYGFILTIVISIFMLIAWAAFAPMDDVVKAQVLLRPSENISSVKCVTSGQLSEMNFQNDKIVKKGDLLFKLDCSVYESELEAYEKEFSKNESDIEANNILIEAILDKSVIKNSNIDSSQLKYLKANAFVIELEKYEKALVELKTKLSREEAKPESLKVPHLIQDLKNEIEQNEIALNVWKTNSKDRALENNKQLIMNKNSLLSKIKEIERIIQNATIIAPIDGIVSEISKHNIGDYILAGEEILKIIPQNNNSLIADIYVDPNYIAQVNIGNSVKIKFPGLPPSRYGQQETTVNIIPPDVTYIGETPVFIVKAEIQEPYLIANNGKKANLLPGISAEGRIVTERCTVLQMILKKLDFIA